MSNPQPLPDRPKVLVVDDNEDIRVLLETLLTQRGHEVKQAENGRVALARLADFKADVILLDLGMPEMDGLAFLRHKQKLEELKPIPVMVLSARESNTDVIEALDLGADNYITKPFDNANLLMRVDQLLRK